MGGIAVAVDTNRGAVGHSWNRWVWAVGDGFATVDNRAVVRAAATGVGGIRTNSTANVGSRSWGSRRRGLGAAWNCWCWFWGVGWFRFWGVGWFRFWGGSRDFFAADVVVESTGAGGVFFFTHSTIIFAAGITCS